MKISSILEKYTNSMNDKQDSISSYRTMITHFRENKYKSRYSIEKGLSRYKE